MIEALGDYKAQYAFEAITAVAKLDGPLQDDAAIALGKIGDKRALETLSALQGSGATPRQPAIAAGICLLGVNCESHEGYLIETLKFADQNPGLPGSAARSCLGPWRRLAINGRSSAARRRSSTIGIPSRDPTRAPIALALGDDRAPQYAR